MVVSFVFSGGKFIQSIEVNEVLPREMSVVPNSATFNGRRVTPTILGDNIQWKLGRAPEVSQGTLKYSVALRNIPKANTSLLTTSTVKVTTADSVIVESQRLITENIVRDVDKNKIETSDVMTKASNPDLASPMTDSVAVTEGDEIFFKISLYIDPKKKITKVTLVDSLESNFVINERSFSINGIPLPSRNLSVRVRSSLYSARVLEKKEIEFMRIVSADLTEMIRKGINEITYSARLVTAPKDTVLKKTAFSFVTNEFGETIKTRSNVNKIFMRGSRKLPAIALETTFVDIPRPVTKIEEKVAEAKRMMEALEQSNTGSVVMEGITFEAGKSLLTAEAKIVLDNIAAILKENSALKLQINGHTDNTGNAVLNRKVSLDRAKQVRNYLVKQGIDEKRLFAQGFGPDKPIESNKTEAGRAKNRRVEFSKISK
jgi:outer membrane protein OmpA-like peptidoglycan-associated protein